MTEHDRELFAALQRFEQAALDVQEIVCRRMPVTLAGVYRNRVHAPLAATLTELKGGPTLDLGRWRRRTPASPH